MAISTLTSIASEDVSLGNASGLNVGRMTISLEDGGSWTGSITVKTRLFGSSATAVSKAYTTPTSGTLATTAITAVPAVIYVTADAEEILISHTRTTGTLRINVARFDG